MRLKPIISTTLIVTILVVLIGALAHIFALHSSVDGIVIPATLFQYQSQYFTENYNYRQRVRKTLQGNNHAFAALIQSDCGGASGCYEHGEVIAHILLRVGDTHFLNMAQTLNPEDRKYLGNLLAVGFQYGSFTDNEKNLDLGVDFPRTTKYLALECLQ